MDVKLPDGTVVRGVPDNMSKADFIAAARRNGYNIPDDTQPIDPLPQPRPQLSPEARQFAMSDNPGVLQQFVGGAKHAWDRAAAGLEGLVPDGKLLSQALNQPDLQELTKQGSKFVNETGPASSVGQFAGEVALTAPVAAALPATLPAQIAGNAVWNASISPDNRGTAAVLGAAGGAAGHGLSKVVGHLTPTAEAEMLLSKGVPLTYGQRLGPPIQSLENTLAKVPYVGAPLRQRSQEALKGWQQATRDIPSQGAATVDDVAKNLGQQYERLLPAEPFRVKPHIDRNSVGYRILQDVPGITGEMLNGIEREVGQVLSGADSPLLYHQAVSILKGLAHEYKTSQDAAQRLYGKGLSAAADQINASWRAALPTSVQTELAAVDQAWAQFVPIRSASTKYVQTLDAPENYTPRMLLQALRQRDATLGKSQFRNTPQGQLAQAGEQVIGSKSNAPSTGSGILSLLAGGGAAALGQTPAALAAAALGAGYGTKTGQKLMIETLPLQRTIVEALRRGAPAATAQGGKKDE